MTLTSEKEIFLREQITSVYFFVAKTIIALASSALAFSIGLQGFLDGHAKLYMFLLPIGWGSLLLSIVLVVIFSICGLSLLYGFFNNLQESGVEINNETQSDIYDDLPWPQDKLTPLEVPRGSLIVLHGLLPHMSKENISPRSRHAYTLHIMSGHDTFAPDNWLQRENAVPFSTLL